VVSVKKDYTPDLRDGKNQSIDVGDEILVVFNNRYRTGIVEGFDKRNNPGNKWSDLIVVRWKFASYWADDKYVDSTSKIYATATKTLVLKKAKTTIE